MRPPKRVVIATSAGPRAPWTDRSTIGQKRQQGFGVGFNQMMVKARFARADHVRLLPVSGNRDQDHVLATLIDAERRAQPVIAP